MTSMVFELAEFYSEGHEQTSLENLDSDNDKDHSEYDSTDNMETQQ